MRRERVLVPVLVGEAETQIVGNPYVSQQRLDARGFRRAIEVIGRHRPEISLYPLGEYPVEAHRFDLRRDGIVVDQFGVAENPWANVEYLLDFLQMQVHLAVELLVGMHEGKRMIIGFGEQFDSTAGDHFAE